MIKKIQFYKSLLIEIVETLCTICLYLDIEGRRNHNQYGIYMGAHFNALKEFSTEMHDYQKKAMGKN